MKSSPIIFDWDKKKIKISAAYPASCLREIASDYISVEQVKK